MSVDKIIIENFKIFEGQHIFDLKDLNIFTGANNSGKSTLFKAISMFSSGLEKGDFPNLDLFTNIAGEFKDLVNRNSNGNSFKIGFFIELGKKKKVPFKVLYEFVDGKGSYYSEGKAQFSNFELIDLNNNFIFGVYNVEKFKVTNENIEYDIKDNSIEPDENYPFKSPMDGNNPAELFIKFNLDFLESFIGIFSNSDFGELLAQMQKLKGKHNNWWGEQFVEETFFDIGINELSLEDLLKDIYGDEFKNLGDYITKETLLFGEDKEDKIWKEYLKLREITKYGEFVEDIIQRLFISIDEGLDFFRKKNFAQISFQNFKDRLIKSTPQFDYLFSLYTHRNESWGGLNDFVRKTLLDFFEIDGYIELKSHLNAAIEVNLVTGLTKTDAKDYDQNPRQNIADLGKGTANLLGLILKTFSLLNEYEKEKGSDKKKQNNKPKRIRQRLILIEEPEAFLHPNWQSKLADFFVYCLAYGERTNIRFLIETHSVYFIQRLQFLVADNKLDKDKIDILFFNPESHKEKFYNMELRKDGMFRKKFGSGFYDETAKLTIDILNIKDDD